MDKGELQATIAEVGQAWNEVIGADWAGGTQRVIRLASEVPTVTNPEPVWARLLDQIEHQRAHLKIVRDWMA